MKIKIRINNKQIKIQIINTHKKNKEIIMQYGNKINNHNVIIKRWNQFFSCELKGKSTDNGPSEQMKVNLCQPAMVKIYSNKSSKNKRSFNRD